MDVDKLRTFLEVISTGNFFQASINLNVTQSTVSARIRALEDRLGQRLFERHASGVTLTDAGRHLQRNAVSILRLWQRAEREANLPSACTHSIGLGTVFSLMDDVVLPWIAWMGTRNPALAIHVETDFSNNLMRELVDGVIDLAVMYEPRQTPGLIVEELLDDDLMLISTDGPQSDADWRAGYVYVDWGDDFRQMHDLELTGLSPTLSFGLGKIALNHILANGGSGYFPSRMVADHLRHERLHRVADMPAMYRTGYVVYSKALGGSDQIRVAIEGLQEVLRGTEGGRPAHAETPVQRSKRGQASR